MLGVVFLSARDLATRRIPGSVSSVQLAFWAYLCITVLAAALLVFDPPVAGTARAWAMMAAASAIGVFGYWAITEAMRAGDVSAIAPFRYSRLVFGLLIGATIFAERPDVLSLAGAALILAAGLYTLFRERWLRRQARLAA